MTITPFICVLKKAEKSCRDLAIMTVTPFVCILKKSEKSNNDNKSLIKEIVSYIKKSVVVLMFTEVPKCRYFQTFFHLVLVTVSKNNLLLYF